MPRSMNAVCSSDSPLASSPMPSTPRLMSTASDTTQSATVSQTCWPRRPMRMTCTFCGPSAMMVERLNRKPALKAGEKAKALKGMAACFQGRSNKRFRMQQVSITERLRRIHIKLK